MSETTAIGNNTLIHSILANRIAETPSSLVPEVEVDMPEAASTKQAAIAEKIVIETPNVEEKKPPNYDEYEEEPAPIQLNIDEVGTSTIINENTEKQSKQRIVVAKWSVKLYDKLQGLIALFAYDKLNAPKNVLARRRELLEKVYAGKLEEKERKELEKINEQADAFMQRRSNYQDTVNMSEELQEDIKELLTDLMVATDKTVNPMVILGILLLLPVLSNFITAFTHKMQYNTKF